MLSQSVLPRSRIRRLLPGVVLAALTLPAGGVGVPANSSPVRNWNDDPRLRLTVRLPKDRFVCGVGGETINIQLTFRNVGREPFALPLAEGAGIWWFLESRAVGTRDECVWLTSPHDNWRGTSRQRSTAICCDPARR